MYCHDWQNEMCTFPPRLKASATGGPASGTAPADSDVNADMTSAPAGARWDRAGGEARSER